MARTRTLMMPGAPGTQRELPLPPTPADYLRARKALRRRISKATRQANFGIARALQAQLVSLTTKQLKAEMGRG